MPVIVACAIWGDWPYRRIDKRDSAYQRRNGDLSLQGAYIERLRNGVARNLSVPHRFICFADDTAKVPEGIEAARLDVPYFSRAMAKAYVYGAPFTGAPIDTGYDILMFDLDTVIVGSLDDMVLHGREMVVRERFYMLPKWVPDGDCVFMRAGSDKAKTCADVLAREMEREGAGIDHGDERELIKHAKPDMWGQILPGQMVSYKRHCQRGLPKGARVVSFHGKNIETVKDEWVKENWR